MQNKIVVAGAGSVGCYVGGALLATGHDVVLLGRELIGDELQSHGLLLTDLDGMDRKLEADTLKFSTTPDVLANAEIILVTVKSLATQEIAEQIAAYAKPDAIVISLQNGVRNADILRTKLKKQTVLAGMVGFNVVHMQNGRFHKGTSGDILIASGIPRLARMLNSPMISIQETEEIDEIQWGKLILNLNKALNALSGIPLKQQLETSGWRNVLGKQISEALAVMAASHIKAKPINGVKLQLVPWILQIPNPLFSVVARKMLQIDPEARSSMWEDLQLVRLTEIAEFQGEIVKLAESIGVNAPISSRIVHLIRDAERTATGSPKLDPRHILTND